MSLGDQLMQGQRQNVLSGLREELERDEPDEKRVDSLVGAARGYGIPEESIQRVLAERKQVTEKGLEIPVPTRGEFDDFVRKVAPPAGRKRPAGTDEPPEQSD